MMEKEVDPLFGEVPSEVALSRAPLVRVLEAVMDLRSVERPV